jgi:hypothetical protein
VFLQRLVLQPRGLRQEVLLQLRRRGRLPQLQLRRRAPRLRLTWLRLE